LSPVSASAAYAVENAVVVMMMEAWPIPSLQ